MIIAAIYYFNGNKDTLCKFSKEINEVQEVIESVNSAQAKTKVSNEKAMPGKEIYSPEKLNLSFKNSFTKRGWTSHRVRCEYSTEHYKRIENEENGDLFDAGSEARLYKENS